VLLEWVLALEGLALAILGIMGLISMLTAKQDMTDNLWVFCATFWREFLWPPAVMPIDAKSTGGAGRRASRGPVARPVEEASPEDEFYGRFKKGADGRVNKVDLEIIVQAHAPSDAVVGRDGDGLKVQVSGEAGESRSNKALIELVATAMGVKPYQVTLTKGHYQQRKTVQIQGVSADELQVRLTVPTTNEDPKKRTPADISGVEVYALTGKPDDPFGNPLNQRDLLKYATKIGDVAIKPPPVPEENDDLSRYIL